MSLKDIAVEDLWFMMDNLHGRLRTAITADNGLLSTDDKVHTLDECARVLHAMMRYAIERTKESEDAFAHSVREYKRVMDDLYVEMESRFRNLVEYEFEQSVREYMD